MTAVLRGRSAGAIKPLEDLSTCPVDWLNGSFVGFCEGCDRPMAGKRRFTTNPALKRWFIRSSTRLLCGGCEGRQRRTGTATPPDCRARRPPPPPQKPKEPLPVALLHALRLAVGACVACGWTTDSGDLHSARGCPKAPKTKRVRTPRAEQH